MSYIQRHFNFLHGYLWEPKTLSLLKTKNKFNKSMYKILGFFHNVALQIEYDSHDFFLIFFRDFERITDLFDIRTHEVNEIIRQKIEASFRIFIRAYLKFQRLSLTDCLLIISI